MCVSLLLSPRFLNYIAKTPAEDLKTSLCLGFTMDGAPVQLHGRGRNYSFWTGSAEILDLTEKYRTDTAYRLHLLLIEGPYEPKQLFPYMEPLIQQLNELKLKCGFVVADVPALHKLLSHQNMGYNGCFWCWCNPERSFSRMSWLTEEDAAAKTNSEYFYLGELKVGVFQDKSVLYGWTDNITECVYGDYMHTIKNIAFHCMQLFKNQRKLTALHYPAKPTKKKIIEKREKEREKRRKKTIERGGIPQRLSTEAQQTKDNNEKERVNDIYKKELSAWEQRKQEVELENEKRRQENETLLKWSIKEQEFSKLNVEWKTWCDISGHRCTSVPFTPKSNTGHSHFSSDDWIKWFKLAGNSKTLKQVLDEDVFRCVQQLSELVNKMDVSV